MSEISFFDRNISNDEMYQYKYIIKNKNGLICINCDNRKTTFHCKY